MTSFFQEYFDFKTFFIAIALTGIGLVSVYSATYDAGATSNFYRQLLFAGLGLIFFFGAAFVPLRALQRLSIPIYIAIVLLLLLVLVFGKTVSGSRSWLGLAGFGIQPSEFAKIAMVLAVASLVSRPNFDPLRVRNFIIVVAVVVVPVGLILAQPDLGTSIVFLVTLLPLLFWWGVSTLVLLALLAPVVTAVAALFGTLPFLISATLSGIVLFVRKENRFISAAAFAASLAVGVSVQTVFDRLPVYQQKRIETFINPGADKLGAGWNVEQSKVAIGSGGILGKGYLQGTQTQLNFIPEQWTDFIFCVVGEEFGLLGAAFALLLFGALLYRSLNLAYSCKAKYTSTAVVGLVSILATHVMINIGMALGITPVIGIPLPFLSYGGSALLANMTTAGLLMNFYMHRKEY